MSADLLRLVDGPLADAVSKAADYAAKAIAPGTVATYKADWADFSRLGAAERGRSDDAAGAPGGGRRLAGDLGAGAGRAAPCAGGSPRSPGITAASGTPGRPGTRRSGRHSDRHRPRPSRPVRPAAALISAEVKRLIAVCPGDLAGLRDRALFLVGLAGAFRRSELVGIDVAHLRFESDSLIVRHATLEDRPGRGGGGCRAAAHARGRRPARCGRWRTGCAGRRSSAGRCSAAITAAGTIEGRLTGDGVYKILRARAAAAQLTVHATERLSPHGLRAGMITEASLNGALDEQIMPHSRHKDAVHHARLSPARADRGRQPGAAARPVRRSPARQRVGPGAPAGVRAGDRLAEEAGRSGAPTASWRDGPNHNLGTPDTPLALAHTDWLRHRLTVSGPAGEVARFQAAARGTAGIPWQLDLDHEEARLLAPMAMLGPEARALARELREVIAARHDQLLTRWAEPGELPARSAPPDPGPGRHHPAGRGRARCAALALDALGHAFATAPGSRARGQDRPAAASLGPRGLRIPVGRLDAVAGHPPAAARLANARACGRSALRRGRRRERCLTTGQGAPPCRLRPPRPATRYGMTGIFPRVCPRRRCCISTGSTGRSTCCSTWRSGSNSISGGSLWSTWSTSSSRPPRGSQRMSASNAAPTGW